MNDNEFEQSSLSYRTLDKIINIKVNKKSSIITLDLKDYNIWHNRYDKKVFVNGFKNFFDGLHPKEKIGAYNNLIKVTATIKETDLEKLSSIIEDYYGELKIEYINKNNLKKIVANNVKNINDNLNNDNLENLNTHISSLNSLINSKTACSVLVLNYETWKYKKFILKKQEVQGTMCWHITLPNYINYSKYFNLFNEDGGSAYQFIHSNIDRYLYTNTPKETLEEYIKAPLYKKILIQEYGDIF